jgi:trehalose 6-phosphate phosphatase
MPTALPQPQRDWALFLDVDGTLLDFAATPDRVFVPQSLIPVLASLGASLDGALALVSGRPIAAIDRLFTPLVLPAAGQHGAELRLLPGGPVERRARPPALDRFLPRLRSFASANSGILVEDKGDSIAVHYRNAPSLADAAYRTAKALVESEPTDLELLPAHMAVDIKPAGVSKGSAIEQLMRAPAFRTRIPVFLGDDLTDEYGFAAVDRLGGEAIRVGDGGPTRARYRIAGPAEVRDWLNATAERLAGRS